MKPKKLLGDRVADAAKALGFEQTPDCGCAARQAYLNALHDRIKAAYEAVMKPRG